MSHPPIRYGTDDARQAMKRYSQPLPRGLDAGRFTLIELVLLTSCSAVSCALVAGGLGLLGLCFLVTVISFRTSIVDFTPVGGLAVLFTIVFGTVSIALLIFWSAGW